MGNLNAREIVRRAAGPAIGTDAANRVVAWNRAARQLLGFESEQKALGRAIHEFLQTRDAFGNALPESGAPFFEMVSQGEPVNSFEVSARKASGERVWVTVSVVVILGPRAEQHEIVYLMRPVLRRRRADEAIERLLADQADGKRGAGSRTDGGPELTRRQLEVLRLVADGLDNREIAKTLGVSVNTVRSHMQGLLETLGVHSQVEAVAKAFRRNLL